MDLLTDDSISSDEVNQDEDEDDGTTTRDTEDRRETPVPEGGRATKRRKQGTIWIVPSHRAPENNFRRAIPHKRGHWSGHILVPLTSELSPGKVQKSVFRFQTLLERHGYSGYLVQHDHLHISLSKHFSLQLAFLDSFVQQLRERLRWESPTRIFVSNEDFEESNSDGELILVNEEKTRTFWGWRVKPNHALLRLVKEIDAVLAKYHQPSYYDPPIFHVSLASFAGNFVYDRNEVKKIRGDWGPSSLFQKCNENGEAGHEESRCDDDDDESGDDENCFNCVSVEKIICKFGTSKEYVIQLGSHA